MPTLSKTRFIAGLQCLRQLWWRTHEPDAPELAPGPGLQARFDEGHRIGALARSHVPGGVLIDRPYYARRAQIEDTRAALDAGAAVVYEAAFMEDDVFVAVDILERMGRGFACIEVKSTFGVKPQHVDDLAVQVHVLRRAGLEVCRAEVMHLDGDGGSDAFRRTDVTAEVEARQADLPGRIAAQLEALAGDTPDVATGAHCDVPYPCPFLSRCR